MSTTSIPLAQLPRELAARTGQPAPTYNQCYKAVLDGRIPADRIGDRWLIKDSDLPAVERAFGLTPATAPATA